MLRVDLDFLNYSVDKNTTHMSLPKKYHTCQTELQEDHMRPPYLVRYGRFVSYLFQTKNVYDS